jgi:flagellar biogenesis protein FliO
LIYVIPGDGRAGPEFPTQRRAMDIVTILIIIILVLLAIYLFQRVF